MVKNIRYSKWLPTQLLLCVMLTLGYLSASTPATFYETITASTAVELVTTEYIESRRRTVSFHQVVTWTKRVAYHSAYAFTLKKKRLFAYNQQLLVNYQTQLKTADLPNPHHHFTQLKIIPDNTNEWDVLMG